MRTAGRAFGAALVYWCAAAPTAATGSLTEAPRLATIYDSILSARFDQAETQVRSACPPAPEGACLALSSIAVSWQILIDPESRALDRRINELTATAIAANDAWTKREPTRAEAWFYLAGSYAPLVQWRVLRGQRLAAAREGKKIKDALERALELDPAMLDAHFGIGMYHYYADVAPAYAKFLRWLFLLPGGDRMKGLAEMQHARDGGELLRDEADYQLHLVYLWYEHQTARALELLEGLDKRHSYNPLFRRQIAEIRNAYLHDRDGSVNAWQTLLDRAEIGAVYDPRGTASRARAAIARLAQK